MCCVRFRCCDVVLCCAGCARSCCALLAMHARSLHLSHASHCSAPSPPTKTRGVGDDGGVSWGSLIAFANAMGGVSVALGVLMLFPLVMGARTFTDWWVGHWISQVSTHVATVFIHRPQSPTATYSHSPTPPTTTHNFSQPHTATHPQPPTTSSPQPHNHPSSITRNQHTYPCHSPSLTHTVISPNPFPTRPNTSHRCTPTLRETVRPRVATWVITPTRTFTSASTAVRRWSFSHSLSSKAPSSRVGCSRRLRGFIACSLLTSCEHRWRSLT
jgi:hypothetical protein